MRDEGHVMHTEAFVIPKREVTVAQLAQARDDLRALDWKLHDTVFEPDVLVGRALDRAGAGEGLVVDFNLR